MQPPEKYRIHLSVRVSVSVASGTVRNQLRLIFPILGHPRVPLLTHLMYLKSTQIAFAFLGFPLPLPQS